ncbi:MAG: tetratricopeptide repeat protein, partial [Anaerolineales bacterium]
MAFSPPSTVTSRLMAALPEALWAEAGRRLRLVPELWALAEDPEVLEAFCALRDPHGWRPGPLALSAYAAKHPECGEDAEAWLLGAGRERVGAAYLQLIQPHAHALRPAHPLDDSLPAALALRLRAHATHDWASLASDAVASDDCAQPGHPHRGRLPLQYLFGLLPDGPNQLFAALLNAGPHGAALAGQCLVVNCAATEAARFVASLNLSPSPSQWLVLAETIEAMSGANFAREVIKASASPTGTKLPTQSLPYARPPLHSLDATQLLAFRDDLPSARSALTHAWAQARELRVSISVQIGELALRDGDPVTAFAGYHDALNEHPTELTARIGLARALLQLRRPAEALAAVLTHAAEPADACAALQVMAARARLGLNEREEAHRTLRGVSVETLADPQLLVEVAQLYFELNDHPTAIRCMMRAAELSPIDSQKYLTAARWLLDTNQPAEAGEMATEAVLLAPDDADARETLGQALLACGQAERAIHHFQSAAAFAPERLSASLGLARAALEAGQPALAHGAAQHLLAAAPDSAIAGEAHTLVGQALSQLQRDDEAFEHFRRASTLAPTAPEPWRAMARHYAQRGSPGQALAALEAGRQALGLIASPHLGPLLSDLAEAYASAGRLTEAILALREACLLNPIA